MTLTTNERRIRKSVALRVVQLKKLIELKRLIDLRKYTKKLNANYIQVKEID